MKNCNGCKWAEWDKPKSGSLHPDGQGYCRYPVKIPDLPNGVEWASINYYHTGISKNKDFDKDCKFYEHIKMKVKIDKELLDQVLAICKILENAEPVKESNWLDSVPEKHRKFAAYWDELGRPELEVKGYCFNHFQLATNPTFVEKSEYRIKNDPHWQLRLKWVNSDKTLPIEIYDTCDKKWRNITMPEWFRSSDYREAIPWYEQEISEEKPMLLRHVVSNSVGLWRKVPLQTSSYKPLTDQEIDALKRGF